ncbi:MAG: SprT family zinc-dependent metalloprotease [Candidatus Saccharibacteria bacterium]|nr:SprT family zinc-dependent metalloprotease [Candidatus Saccharibacteria bacterium]
MAARHIVDTEFGTIEIRRIKTARHVKIGVTPRGLLRATLPPLVPLLYVRTLVANSRDEIRTLLANAVPATVYHNGMRIGKNHALLLRDGAAITANRRHTTITITKPAHLTEDHPEVQAAIRQAVIAALRREAKQYLPNRLQILAQQHGYRYERVRFSHAGTRWGSCSSRGTISLNIALMKLPFELIDYVLIHELCHTKQMNHSREFWNLVAAADPSYKRHVTAIKNYTPTI